jgi:D-alanyl-D-alanine carboxypeptidase
VTRRQVSFLVLASAALTLASCGQNSSVNTPKKGATPPELAAKLGQLLVDEQKTDVSTLGRALTVETDNWHWSKAVGAVAGSNKQLTAGHSFRIASMTKPFVAAAILRLMEDGKLDISKPIAGYISKETDSLLRQGGYDPGAISVQDVMSHTSGIYNFAYHPAFAEKVLSVPSHSWTRQEQIAMAMERGKPLGKPGAAFGYSDTGYVILGEIIEQLTNAKLGPAVRQLLDYERLGLRHTYWEQMETPPAGLPFAGNRMDAADLTNANHSFDLYGGGGLISTVDDLSRFMRALGRGDVFRKPDTLAMLLAIPDADRKGEASLHGNALSNFRVGRWDCIGHSGFWGQIMAYCPEAQLSIGWTVNQAGERPEGEDFLTKLGRVFDERKSQ